MVIGWCAIFLVTRERQRKRKGKRGILSSPVILWKQNYQIVRRDFPGGPMARTPCFHCWKEVILFFTPISRWIFERIQFIIFLLNNHSTIQPLPHATTVPTLSSGLKGTVNDSWNLNPPGHYSKPLISGQMVQPQKVWREFAFLNFLWDISWPLAHYSSMRCRVCNTFLQSISFHSK